MNKYSPDRVHRRVDYIQYTYSNTQIHPRAFEISSFPVAVYDHDGKIAGANKIFRDVAGITEEDILNRKANIFDCINETNTILIEAAHGAFDGEEKVYLSISPALNTNGCIADYQITLYPNAIFFPMSYDGDGVRLAGVLLDEETTDDD